MKDGNRGDKLRQKKVAAAANPFDKFNNAKRKHEVVNRRVKGEDRDVGRAREKSTQQRKVRLTQQIRASKNSNLFVDKRFGEADATLSLEDKMFLRFQKERSSRLRNSSIFNLDEAGAGTEGGSGVTPLTHKGRQLGVGNAADMDDFSDDDGT